MPSPLCRALGILLALVAALAFGSAGAAERPHVIYITVDDLGWKDVGYHGSTIQTPTLDQLATSGARLEQFYVQPFSSQTRAAVMTGRYPMRYGFQTMQIQWYSRFGLPANERLLPAALKEAGYRTALIGKWQLGHAKKELWPTQRGFDHFYGHLTGEIDYFKKTDRGGHPDWRRNDRQVKEPGYATTLLGREAVHLIADARIDPTLVPVARFRCPAGSAAGTRGVPDRYPEVKDEHERAYRAMISAVDAAVSDVLAALERRGMRGDTLLIFHSTTGGAVGRKYAIGDGDARTDAATNGPYRDGKGSLYEGALRVVAFANWPDRIQAGVVGEVMHAVDLYPTLLNLAGAQRDQLKPLDGIDMWRTISQGAASPRKEVLLNVEDFRGGIRIGDWKLVRIATLPAAPSCTTCAPIRRRRTIRPNARPSARRPCSSGCLTMPGK